MDVKDYSIKYRLELFSGGLMAAYSLRKGHLVDLSDILSELTYRKSSKPQSEYFHNLLLQKSEKFETGLVLSFADSNFAGSIEFQNEGEVKIFLNQLQRTAGREMDKVFGR